MTNILIRILRIIDIYGTRVQPFYNGQSKIRSCGGGILTLMACALIAIYVYLIVSSPVNLENSSNSLKTSLVTNTTTSDSSSSSPSGTTSTLQFTKSIETRSYSKSQERYDNTTSIPMTPNWAFAFMPSFNLDPTIVSLNIFQINQSFGAQSSSSINYAACNSTTFPIQDFTRAENMYISYYMCPDASSVKLVGDPIGMNSKYLSLSISKCSTTGCADDATMNSTLNNAEVILSTLESSIDSSNTSNPINQYINDFNQYLIDVSQSLNIAIELEQIDYIFLNGTTITTLRTHNQQSYILPLQMTNKLFDLIVFIGPVHTVYEQYKLYTPVLSRNLDTTTTTTNSTSSDSSSSQEFQSDIVYKIFFVMAQIGGFYSFLKMVFGGFVGVFSEKLFAIELINRLKEFRSKRDTKGLTAGKYRLEGNSKVQPVNAAEELKDEEVQMVISGHHFSPNVQHVFYPKHTETFNATPTQKPSDYKQIKYDIKDMVYSVACCWRKKIMKPNQQIVTLRQRSEILHQETASLFKAIDLAAITNTLKDLTEKVNELQQKGLRISMDDDFPFVKQSDGKNPNPKSDFNPSNFKMKEDQPKYSVNFNPAKTASAMNPLAGNKQKTNHKEETKSINEIVSKELSMISDEIHANKAAKPNNQDNKSKPVQARDKDDKSFDFGDDNERNRMIG